jgi:hypothetical protein
MPLSGFLAAAAKAALTSSIVTFLFTDLKRARPASRPLVDRSPHERLHEL